MVQITASSKGFFLLLTDRFFHAVEASFVVFLTEFLRIDWNRLVVKRPSVPDTIDAMPAYLLKPKSFISDDYDFRVVLKTLKQRPGRLTKKALQRWTKHYISIADLALEDCIQSDLHAGLSKKTERIFLTCRQTVYRHIHTLVKRVGGTLFATREHTFRHSLAIHLLLHGRPLKYVSQLLGYKSVDITEIYTNVLAIDGTHFWDGVDFH